MRILRTILILAAVSYSSVAVAATSLPVNWQQNNISLSQMQNVFASNPNVSQFNFQFPNGTNWNVNSMQMQNLYAQYKYKAQNVSFSSLPGNTGIQGDSVMIPIENAKDNVEGTLQNGLQQLQSSQNDFINSIFKWINLILTAIYNGAILMYQSVVNFIKKLF